MPIRLRPTELAISRCRSAFESARCGCISFRIDMQGLVSPRVGNENGMLRKLVWTALYATLGAAATMAARRLASRLYRIVTGEEPPTKK